MEGSRYCDVCKRTVGKEENDCQEMQVCSKCQAALTALRQQNKELTELCNAVADAIENIAADRAYKSEMGVSEWEAFLKPQEKTILTFMAKYNIGTWGKEKATQAESLILIKEG